MPADFEKCVKSKGSKIRTISGPSKEHNLDENQYVHYCIDSSGKSYRGEVKVNKGKKVLEEK